jgi:hypothetical protein
MQQLETLPQRTLAETRLPQAVQAFLRRWLTGRRGLIVAAAALVLAGLALGWSWLTAIGVAPVLLSLAPCAAMCAIGACAMGRGNASCAKPTAADAAGAPEAAATADRSDP